MAVPPAYSLWHICRIPIFLVLHLFCRTFYQAIVMSSGWQVPWFCILLETFNTLISLIELMSISLIFSAHLTIELDSLQNWIHWRVYLYCQPNHRLLCVPIIIPADAHGCIMFPLNQLLENSSSKLFCISIYGSMFQDKLGNFLH